MQADIRQLTDEQPDLFALLEAGGLKLSGDDLDVVARLVNDVWVMKTGVRNAEAKERLRQVFELNKLREQERIADERLAARQKALDDRQVRAYQFKLIHEDDALHIAVCNHCAEMPALNAGRFAGSGVVDVPRCPIDW
jgi:hypothetical protein